MLIYNCIRKIITDYSFCFVYSIDRLSREQINKYGTNKCCDSYDEAKEIIEKEGIDDLMTEINLQVGFLEEYPYRVLFGSIVSKMKSKRVYNGKLMSEIEIELLKGLMSRFNVLAEKQYGNSEIVRYVENNKRHYKADKAIDSKRGVYNARKHQDNLKALHNPRTKVRQIGK